MSRDKRDAERAARRAKRLAERAEERARRKEEQAERAEHRAERLADRVSNRPQRQKDLDQSIEDLVDQVTQKAEDWIDETSQRLFQSDESGADSGKAAQRAETQAERAREDAARARRSANRAERAAKELSELETELGSERDDEFFDVEQPRRSSKRRSRRSRSFGWGSDSGQARSGRSTRRLRSAHLYRDIQNKKLFGVCAGFADYVGRPAWEMRLYAVLGLFFIPSVIIPVYFIAYFLMEDKPYYRRVTDRFDEAVSGDEMESQVKHNHRRGPAVKSSKVKSSKINNIEAMRTAREKFSDIEQRLRQMETHVTSSRFELQRELKKISAED